eukprot:GFUD01021833.1.p1 GENE.GFUD01021833.1~~GFUD01021833.1.p1  ORF type:complete len:196 (+),score=55.34 GFUD01021833.1:42-629(+)
MALLKFQKIIPRISVRFYCAGALDAPYSKNDIVAPRIRNRNPMNLEKMLIGKKPRGFDLENKSRNYWNKLELEISNNHTTAVVTHWTGRVVAKASTQEWPIRQFLYNLTDQAALKVVGQVISQRCLETGVSEVYLGVTEEDKGTEKMVKFIDVIEKSGLSLTEAEFYQPSNPHIANFRTIQQKKVHPWTVLEPEN